MADEILDVVSLVMSKITTEFQTIINLYPDTYSGYKFVITNEQQFVKYKDEAPNTIFMVVKFLQGNRDLGQLRQPFTINAVSEQNTLDVCQKLMMDFAETYNLSLDTSESGYILRQTMTTVSSVSNFGEVFAGFRSVFYLSGTMYIGQNGNIITDAWIGQQDDDHKIEFISAHWNYDTQYDSQPFFNTNNFNKTVNKIATFTVAFSLYLKNDIFCNEVLSTVFNETNSDGTFKNDINKEYTIILKLKGSETVYSAKMRLVGTSGSQELRDFPAITATFLR